MLIYSDGKLTQDVIDATRAMAPFLFLPGDWADLRIGHCEIQYRILHRGFGVFRLIDKRQDASNLRLPFDASREQPS